MKKKIIAVCLIVALAATAVIGGTLAYFTDKDVAKNTFTVGNVDIELTEPKWTSTGSQDAPEVYPGEPLAKDPTVENIGANPCFVRIKVEGLDCLGNAGLITTRYKWADGYNTAQWVYHNGYYYYMVNGSGVMQPGTKSAPLFDQIVIPTGLTNGDATTLHNVVVTAEAVQAQGAKASFAQVEAMTVTEIADWFTTCGL